MHRLSLSILFALSLFACGGKNPPPDQPPAGGACVKSGCSSTVCTEPGNDVITTCEFKAEYACYQTASCEKQPDGKCGWTQTPELTACLANPPPIDGAPPAPGPGSAAPSTPM